jgi:TRAP-type mannitol/chloroaromatic compound transport system substrate-binding protein
MRRREILAGAGLAAGASLGLSAPAFSQGARRLTMVTDWPEGPGLLESARRFARSVATASAGRLDIEVSPAGAVVRPVEALDAVEAAIADLVHTHIGYYDRRSPVLHAFSGLPFGLTADELYAWVTFGGGQALLDEIGAASSVKPLLCSSTGAQMGGWFLTEIATTADLAGLRCRMAGFGAEVYRRLGAVAVMLPGSQIVEALGSGAIDACEWIGPWLDLEMGLDRVANVYHYPGWQEPGACLVVAINLGVWESLAAEDRHLIEIAAAAEFARSLAEFNVMNAHALDRLRSDGRVAIRPFGDEVLARLAEVSRDVVAEAGSAGALERRIMAAYMAFRTRIRGWSEVAEAGYFARRHLSP